MATHALIMVWGCGTTNKNINVKDKARIIKQPQPAYIKKTGLVCMYYCKLYIFQRIFFVCKIRVQWHAGKVRIPRMIIYVYAIK